MYSYVYVYNYATSFTGVAAGDNSKRQNPSFTTDENKGKYSISNRSSNKARVNHIKVQRQFTAIA